MGFSIDAVNRFTGIVRLRIRVDGGSNIHIGYYLNREYARAQGNQILDNLNKGIDYLNGILPDYKSQSEIINKDKRRK